MRHILILFLALSAATSSLAKAQDNPAPADGTAKKELPLDINQQAVLGRFDRFEQEVLKMAEQMRRQDPERSDLLFRAHSRSQQEQIIAQMRVIFEQLSKEDISFGDAIQRQEALVASMKALLEVLQSENRIGDIEAERQRIQGIIKDVNKLLGDEKDARALTERGSDAERAAKKQEDIEKKAADLIEGIKKTDEDRQAEEQSRNGTPQDGQPKDGEQKPGDQKDGENSDPKGDEKSPQEEPEDSKIQNKDKDKENGEQSPSDDSQQGDQKDGEQNSQSQQQQGQQGQSQESQQQQTPGRQDLEQAREEMQRAIDELKKKNEKDASKHQDEAIRRLLEAKEKLEEILRQLREEEKALMLTSLESRFKKMLSEQLLIYQDTVQLGAKGKDEPNLGPRARQLARREDEIVQEVNKAMILLQEEGSSVAFPEAVEAIRDDMRSIVRLLDKSDVGELTQTAEQNVIESLEEMIDALNKEMQKKDDDKQQRQGQQGQPSAPGEQPLVDALSEIKMLRSLQLRINKRTQQLSKLAEGPEALNPELIDQIRTLSRRQAKIQRATFDLSTGRNQ